MWARLKARPLDLYILYRTLALTWAFMPFQVFYLQARGLDLGSVFDLNVVFSLATVVFEVPTGIFADRNGRRAAMALSGVVMTASCALFVVGARFETFALANVGCALSMTLASGADSAYLYDYLAERHETHLYARYEGLATAAKGIGNLIAVLVGGALYSLMPSLVFVGTGALTILAALVALALPERRHPARDDTPFADFLRASRILTADPRLICLLLFGAITFVLLRMSLFADQPHLEVHFFAASAAQLAFAAALLAAAKEIGGAVLASMSGGLFHRVRTTVLAPALAASIVVIYAGMGEGIGIACIALMVLLSSEFGLFSPLMRALMNRLIPGPRDRATLLSFESMGRRLLFAAASPLFGRAAEASSLHAAFSGTAWVAGAVYLVLGASVLSVLRTSAPPVGSALATNPG